MYVFESRGGRHLKNRYTRAGALLRFGGGARHPRFQSALVGIQAGPPRQKQANAVNELLFFVWRPLLSIISYQIIATKTQELVWDCFATI